MSFRKKLANNTFLRSFFMPILRMLNFEFCWKHDVTNRKFYLLSYLHKGYWYYGLKREERELERFRQFVKEGNTVLEIGGHIGYLTQIFEDFVGKSGQVVVVEPTEFSRRFLSKNTRSDTIILPIAISNKVGNFEFYTEKFGGFTNSLVAEFTENSNKVLSQSLITKKANVTKIQVETSTLDIVCKDYDISPHFIKIDVEGAELDVLKGASYTLRNVKALMVEISRNHIAVYKLLSTFDFVAYDQNLDRIANKFPSGNIFFIKH